MQLAAICGDCQLVKIARFDLGTKIADQLHDIAPHQRLAPGQANFARSHRHKFTAHLFKLFERQKFRFWQECHFFCHAIYTAKITAILHRYPDIINRSAKGINKRAWRRLRGHYNTAFRYMS